MTTCIHYPTLCGLRGGGSEGWFLVGLGVAVVGYFLGEWIVKLL